MDDPSRSLTVLVTGGSGFVGGAVVAELLRHGHGVVATTTRSRADLPLAPALRWVSWDAIRDPLPAVAWDDLQAVIHLAAPADLFRFPEQATPIFEVTVAATFRLLEAVRSHGIRRLIFASTGDVLGPSEGLAREDDVTYRPSSFYGTAKACAELLLRAYLPVVWTTILRLYHPYGPGGDRFLINRLVRRVAEGHPIRIEGHDGIRINPVWIDDLARGIRQAVEADATGAFHLAGPQVLTLRELLEIAGSIVGRDPIIVAEDRPPVAKHAGSCDAARRAFGYDPQVSIPDGLERLWSGLGRRAGDGKREANHA